MSDRVGRAIQQDQFLDSAEIFSWALTTLMNLAIDESGVNSVAFAVDTTVNVTQMVQAFAWPSGASQMLDGMLFAMKAMDAGAARDRRVRDCSRGPRRGVGGSGLSPVALRRG